MKALQEMATLAAANYIKGSSFKRNSILKPLDIILDNLEQEPKDDMRDLVRLGSAQQIFDHISRIAKGEHKPGERKLDIIRAYTNIFFTGVLETAHDGDVNQLLQREKLIRSAYLLYFRDALPEREKVQADTEQVQEGAQTTLDFGE